LNLFSLPVDLGLIFSHGRFELEKLDIVKNCQQFTCRPYLIDFLSHRVLAELQVIDRRMFCNENLEFVEETFEILLLKLFVEFGIAPVNVQSGFVIGLGDVVRKDVDGQVFQVQLVRLCDRLVNHEKNCLLDEGLGVLLLREFESFSFYSSHSDGIHFFILCQSQVINVKLLKTMGLLSKGFQLRYGLSEIF
jgi:hypothetical protein